MLFVYRTGDWGITDGYSMLFFTDKEDTDMIRAYGEEKAISIHYLEKIINIKELWQEDTELEIDTTTNTLTIYQYGQAIRSIHNLTIKTFRPHIVFEKQEDLKDAYLTLSVIPEEKITKKGGDIVATLVIPEEDRRLLFGKMVMNPLFKLIPDMLKAGVHITRIQSTGKVLAYLTFKDENLKMVAHLVMASLSL